MDIDTPAVRRLRDALVELGERPSLSPPNPALQVLPGADQPELQAVMERVAPIGELLFLVMSSDGVCDMREHATLIGTLRMMSDGALPTDTLNAMLGLFAERAMAEGTQARMQRVAMTLSADPVDADAAFSAAAALVMSDGEITAEETVMLEDIAEWLGLGVQHVSALLDE